jgi:arylsulfatase A-like enzyme
MKRHRTEPMLLYFPMALTHGPLIPTPDEPKATGRVDRLKAMVRHTDKLVGRLVAALEEQKIRSNTIVIFTTDNGSAVGGSLHGRKQGGGKGKKWERGVCAPFVVNGPGLVPAGVTSDALTDFTDILPTFAELGGASIPKGTVMDGVSIAPVLLGKAKDSPRQWIMALGHGAARLDETGVRGQHDYASRVIRDKTYKVWVDTDRRITQLYDLKDDPYEERNLLGSTKPAHQAAMKKFQAVVDGMPPVDARMRYDPRPAKPWDRKPGKARRPKRARKPRKSRTRAKKAASQ